LIEADVEKSSQKLSSQHAVHLIAVRIYVFTVNDLGRTTRRQERFNGGRISESGVVARKIADDNHAETFLEMIVAVAAVVAASTGAAPAALSLSAVSALTFRLFYGRSDGLFNMVLNGNRCSTASTGSSTGASTGASTGSETGSSTGSETGSSTGASTGGQTGTGGCSQGSQSEGAIVSTLRQYDMRDIAAELTL
jgi:uncharacterized MAPEG superfamily protein